MKYIHWLTRTVAAFAIVLGLAAARPASATVLQFDATSGIVASFTMTLSAYDPVFYGYHVDGAAGTFDGRTITGVYATPVPDGTVNSYEGIVYDNMLYDLGNSTYIPSANSIMLSLAGTGPDVVGIYHKPDGFYALYPNATGIGVLMAGATLTAVPDNPGGDTGGDPGSGTAVPEPASFALLGVGLFGLVLVRRRGFRHA